MKETYIRYRIGLFIWLLSLYTLSSCVHTGRTLGVDLYQDFRVEIGLDSGLSQGSGSVVQEKEPKKSSNVDWKKWYAVMRERVLYFALGIIMGTAGAWYCCFRSLASHPIEHTTANTTAALPTVSQS